MNFFHWCKSKSKLAGEALKRDPRPIQRQKFNDRIARISEHCRSNSPMMKIPAIAVMEMKLALHAYYGGPWKMLYWLFREQFFLWRNDMYGAVIIAICDFMGWTKLYNLPGSTPERPMMMRHGRKCSGSPNCNDMDCIERSLPRWFFFITKWYWNK